MIRRINPVAKAIAMSRRKTATQVVPDKKKYNRKKDKDNAEKMKSLKTKPRKAKRDDWKRTRKVLRNAKRETQERWYA
jgi:hypothetical protein